MKKLKFKLDRGEKRAFGEMFLTKRMQFWTKKETVLDEIQEEENWKKLTTKKTGNHNVTKLINWQWSYWEKVKKKRTQAFL